MWISHDLQFLSVIVVIFAKETKQTNVWAIAVYWPLYSYCQLLPNANHQLINDHQSSTLANHGTNKNTTNR